MVTLWENQDDDSRLAYDQCQLEEPLQDLVLEEALQADLHSERETCKRGLRKPSKQRRGQHDVMSSSSSVPEG
jgi:hypothetical protein